MYQMILRTQWRRARLGLAPLALIAFMMPLLMVTSGGELELGEALGANATVSWLQMSAEIGRLMPVLALAVGVFLGLMAWLDDHRGAHVYALALPLPRELFVLMRFGASLALLLVPVAGLLAGSLVATAAIELPEGLHAYPVAFTTRFALSSLLCLAVFFTISIATRRAAVVVFGLIAALVLGQFLLALVGVQYDLVQEVIYFLTTAPSPLELLTGQWALFDV